LISVTLVDPSQPYTTFVEEELAKLMNAIQLIDPRIFTGKKACRNINKQALVRSNVTTYMALIEINFTNM
jgi:hypothetical protein